MTAHPLLSNRPEQPSAMGPRLREEPSEVLRELIKLNEYCDSMVTAINEIHQSLEAIDKRLAALERRCGT